MGLLVDPLVILSQKDVTPWKVVTDDPDSGSFDGQTILNTTDNQLKVWYNGCWNVLSTIYSGEAVAVDEQFIIDDQTTADKTYFCQAPVGTLTSSAEWRVWVIDETNGIYQKLYADGNDSYDNVADNRAALTYS
jgi:hypothetical protein